MPELIAFPQLDLLVPLGIPIMASQRVVAQFDAMVGVLSNVVSQCFVPGGDTLHVDGSVDFDLLEPETAAQQFPSTRSHVYLFSTPRPGVVLHLRITGQARVRPLV